MKYLTQQCKLILAIIEEYGHMTAEEVHAEAQKSMPKIAVGTVYRNLNELIDAGVIRKIPVPNAPDRFDRTIAPHEHLICPRCGTTEDLFIEGLDDCIRKAVDGREYGFCLTVNALCRSCLSKEETSPSHD